MEILMCSPRSQINTFQEKKNREEKGSYGEVTQQTHYRQIAK